MSAAVRLSSNQHPTASPPSTPVLRGERLAGVMLTRSGPLAAGLISATGLLAAILVPLGGWRPWIVVPVLLVIAVGLVRLVPLLAPPAAAPPGRAARAGEP